MARKKEKNERPQHFFYVDVAEQIGIIPTILLEYFSYWVRNNSIYRQEETFRDGKYWSYCSVAYIQERHPYLTVKQVNGGINKLINEGLIETGNYNKKAYDRTKWYTLTDKGYELMGWYPEEKTVNVNDEEEPKKTRKRASKRVF